MVLILMRADGERAKRCESRLEQRKTTFADSAQRGEETVVTSIVRGVVSTLNRTGHARAGSLVGLAGQGWQDVGCRLVQRRQRILAGGGKVVGRARLNRTRPDRKPGRIPDNADVSVVRAVPSGFPQIMARFGFRYATGWFNQGAVDGPVRPVRVPAGSDRGGKPGWSGGDDSDGSVHMPISGRLADPFLTSEMIDFGAADKAAQRQYAPCPSAGACFLRPAVKIGPICLDQTSGTDTGLDGNVPSGTICNQVGSFVESDLLSKPTLAAKVLMGSSRHAVTARHRQRSHSNQLPWFELTVDALFQGGHIVAQRQPSMAQCCDTMYELDAKVATGAEAFVALTPYIERVEIRRSRVEV